MNKVLYGFASPFHLVTFVLITQSCRAIADQNDECETAPFLKLGKCNHSSCGGPLAHEWRKIKCNPYFSGAHRGSCSRWCKKLLSCCGGVCLEDFQKLSSNQFNSIWNNQFCVVPCRVFLFRIRLISKLQ